MSQLAACYTCFRRPGPDEWISEFVLSSWHLNCFIRRSCGISLAGAATSIIFVVTNMYLCLSWQNTSFVMTKVCLPRQNVCHDKIMFVGTKVLLRQKTCYVFVVTKISLSGQNYVVTEICLLQQKFCCDKHSFVMIKDMFCCDKHVFVETKLSWRRKWYLWQLLPMIVVDCWQWPFPVFFFCS